MKALKQKVSSLAALIICSFGWAQQINLPQEPMGSVDIAALYIPSTIIAAAEQMPEDSYAFRPTPDVRSFGELIAHIAESNFEMCVIAKGESTPVPTVGPTKTIALKALQDSFACSAAARKNLTPQQKERLVKFMGGTQPARNVLDFSVFHSLQHYGNIIVYMRLKGLVPPSSQEN